jgi:hypothetical protein
MDADFHADFEEKIHALWNHSALFKKWKKKWDAKKAAEAAAKAAAAGSKSGGARHD